MNYEVPLGHGVVALVDEVDLIPVLFHSSWCLRSGNYAHNGREDLHIFIAKRMGLDVSQTIDHKDRNKLNCKRDNLRVASRTLQILNQELRAGSESNMKCICWHGQRKKWHVRFHRDGKHIHVGLYEKLEDALKARDTYLVEHGIELIDN